MDSCPHCGSTLRGPNPLAQGETDPDEDTENLPDRRYASGPP